MLRTVPTTTWAFTTSTPTRAEYFDQATGERYVPYVIEPSFGLTRSMMAFLVDAYVEDEAPTLRVAWTSASC